MERRFSQPSELRTDGGRELYGLAAVWDQPAQIGRFSEIVKRGAFRRSLAAGGDIALLADHDTTRLLARTKSGTLALSESPAGLAFSAQMPRTTTADDLLELIRRGDAAGCSFAFTCPPGGDHWPASDRRELRDVDLAEISIVVFKPAYQGTSVSARSACLPVSSARLRLALI